MWGGRNKGLRGHSVRILYAVGLGKPEFPRLRCGNAYPEPTRSKLQHGQALNTHFAVTVIHLHHFLLAHCCLFAFTMDNSPALTNFLPHGRFNHIYSIRSPLMTQLGTQIFKIIANEVMGSSDLSPIDYHGFASPSFVLLRRCDPNYA